MDLTFGPVLLDDDALTQLRPLFDPTLRIYNVELWQHGALVAVHGQDAWFETADAVDSAIDFFLTGHGVRQLTKPEHFELYGALLKERGGAAYQVFLRMTARRF